MQQLPDRRLRALAWHEGSEQWGPLRGAVVGERLSRDLERTPRLLEKGAARQQLCVAAGDDPLLVGVDKGGGEVRPHRPLLGGDEEIRVDRHDEDEGPRQGLPRLSSMGWGTTSTGSSGARRKAMPRAGSRRQCVGI